VRNREGVFNNIFVAAIDDATIQEYGRWPFDRKVYTNVLDHFNAFPEERRPSLIMFDVIFDAPSDPDSDKVLIESFANYGGTVGEDFIVDVSRDVRYVGSTEDIIAQRKRVYQRDSLDYYSPRALAMRKFELDREKNFDISRRAENRMFTYNRITTMMPEIADNLNFAGIANTDAGAIIRKKPLVFKLYYYTNTVTNIGGRDVEDINLVSVYFPSIVLSMAIQLLDASLDDILVREGEIIVRNALVDGKRVNYRIPVDERFRLAVNYKAPQDADYIRVVSLKDVNMFSPQGLRRDTVFLVGLFAMGVAHDYWTSPLGDMFGVLHLGYALGTIMNHDYIVEVPDWINIIYVILLTVGIGILISRGIKSTVASGLLAIVLPLVVGFTLFQFNVDLIMMVPLISGVLALLSGVIYLLLTEEKEKKFIKTTFSSYVSPELVDILVQNPEKLSLGGDSKDLTIMFSDIRSFTTFSEGMTPEYLINFLNVYLSRMTEIVMETKGTLDKYIGDAVMAFWGAPIDIEDHAYKACAACVKMMDALDEFNADRAKVGDKPIDIGIGLNSAVVNVGNVGSEQRKNYTVIGDGVNLASRLEGANKEYRTHIIISENTYEKVKGKVIARELDRIRVKGKKLPVTIYELIDVIEEAGSAEAGV